MQTQKILVVMGQKACSEGTNKSVAIRVSRMEPKNLIFPCASSATIHHLAISHLVLNLQIHSVSLSPQRSFVFQHAV